MDTYLSRISLLVVEGFILIPLVFLCLDLSREGIRRPGSLPFLPLLQGQGGIHAGLFGCLEQRQLWCNTHTTNSRI